MSAPPLPETPLPDSWGQVLDRMLQTLDGAVAALAERERQLATAPPGDTQSQAKWQQAFAGVEQGLDQLRASVEQAERHTAEMDALLAADANGLQGWVAQTTAAVQRLAIRGSGGV